jgi:hypothetical protein
MNFDKQGQADSGQLFGRVATPAPSPSTAILTAKSKEQKPRRGVEGFHQRAKFTGLSDHKRKLVTGKLIQKIRINCGSFFRVVTIIAQDASIAACRSFRLGPLGDSMCGPGISGLESQTPTDELTSNSHGQKATKTDASTANVARLQHFIHQLAPTGIARFVLANCSMSSYQSGECDIRKAQIDADLVDCMVARPIFGNN